MAASLVTLQMDPPPLFVPVLAPGPVLHHNVSEAVVSEI